MAAVRSLAFHLPGDVCEFNAQAPLPLTQADVGDTCGVAPEHTNRTLRELRNRGLCSA